MRLSGSREDGRRAKSVGLSSDGFGYINEIGIYMALVRPLRGFVPVIGENTFLADTAAIIGDVNKITVGDRVNIQDGVVVHTLYQRSVTEIGDDVSIGHNANIHGARIESRCLIGMGATVLDHAVVGTGSIVAANSLVLSRTVIEPGSVYAGVPAKRVKDVTPEQVRDIIERTARDYMMYASWYKE